MERKLLPIGDEDYARLLRESGRGAELLAEQMKIMENPDRWAKAVRRSETPAQQCWWWALQRLRAKYGERPPATRLDGADPSPTPVLALVAPQKGKSGAGKTKRKTTPNGQSACQVIRGLAGAGSTLDQCRKSVKELGFDVAEATLRIQFRKGQKR